MQISVELSCYPLADDFIPMISEFIKKINQHPEVTAITNTMSTQLFGESDVVMPLLNRAMEGSWAKDGKAVFVCKFINAELNPN
ncbi:MAG: hypothetical protein GY829_15280 [Gammaproteobacteria bacterium]|nr:hypothetical protein [Gammaproteobacteria bacterium]